MSIRYPPRTVAIKQLSRAPGSCLPCQAAVLQVTPDLDDSAVRHGVHREFLQARGPPGGGGVRVDQVCAEPVTVNQEMPQLPVEVRILLYDALQASGVPPQIVRHTIHLDRSVDELAQL